jgi:predicted enzyme related to lactoylglutathione lyase
MAEPRLQIVASDAALSGPALSAITFFYYDDLPRAAAFYREVVGLKLVMVHEWCAICELAGGARLGLIDGLSGSQRPIPSANKGAILSLQVDDLEACLERCVARGLIPADEELAPGCGGLTREFKICDPGGYTIEFFRWIEDAGASLQGASRPR